MSDNSIFHDLVSKIENMKDPNFALYSVNFSDNNGVPMGYAQSGSRRTYSYYYGRRRPQKEIFAYADRPELIVAATALGIFNPKNISKLQVIPSTVRYAPEFRSLIEKIEDNYSVVYKQEEHPELSLKYIKPLPKLNFDNYYSDDNKLINFGLISFDYYGDVPDKYAYRSIYERALNQVNDFWHSNIMSSIKKDNMWSRRPRVKSLDKATALINAINLEEYPFSIKKRKGGAPRPYHKVLGCIDIHSPNLPDDVILASESLDYMKDMMLLWQHSFEMERLTINLYEEDLDNAKQLSDLFKHWSDLTEMSEALYAYQMGVQVEDIIV